MFPCSGTFSRNNAFPVFRRCLPRVLAERPAECRDMAEAALNGYILKSVLRVLVHQGYALPVYAQPVYVVIERRGFHIAQVVAQIGAVGACHGGKLAQRKPRFQIWGFLGYNLFEPCHETEGITPPDVSRGLTPPFLRNASVCRAASAVRLRSSLRIRNGVFVQRKTVEYAQHTPIRKDVMSMSYIPLLCSR